MPCSNFSNPLAVARLIERFSLTVIVVLLAVVILVAFWRTVHRLELNVPSLKIGASVVLVTPVLVLAVLCGFSWIVLSNPITVECPGEIAQHSTKIQQNAHQSAQGRIIADQGGGRFSGVGPTQETAGAGAQSTRGEASAAFDISALEPQMWAFNCALEKAKPNLTEIDIREIQALKMEIIERVWDPKKWGSFQDFSKWADNQAKGADDYNPPSIPSGMLINRSPRC